MPSKFQNIVVIARQPNFQDRVKFAMQAIAIVVMKEDPQTASHAERVVFAKNILSGVVNSFEMSVGILTEKNISDVTDPTQGVEAQFGIADADIQTAVNSLFNAFA